LYLLVQYLIKQFEQKYNVQNISSLKEEQLLNFFASMRSGEIKTKHEKAHKSVKKCDAILVETSEKARGAYFEIGYAKALKKKIIVIHQEGTEAAFLEAATDVSIEYENFEDLKEKIENI